MSKVRKINEIFGRAYQKSRGKLRYLLQVILAARGYQLQGIRYKRQLLNRAHLLVLEFDDCICRHIFEAGPELTFIQVGAFDGIVGDPLRKYVLKCGWRGILIEPQARAAGKLRELYSGNDRIIVLQAALDRKSGNRKIFTVDPQNGPSWVGGLASFELKTILKHSDLVPSLETMIREDTVNCVTFERCWNTCLANASIFCRSIQRVLMGSSCHYSLLIE